jgi:hypothetical protein
MALAGYRRAATSSSTSTCWRACFGASCWRCLTTLTPPAGSSSSMRWWASDRSVFKRFLGPLHHIKWVVYCKAPFAGPGQVLRYLSRYTHRVAISNRRLISTGDDGIAFRWKDYREDHLARWKTMTLSPFEFIRRFLVHVLPKGFHRIRHYGLLANGNRREAIATARELLGQANVERADAPAETETARDPPILPGPCPCCGSAMRTIETFARGCEPRHQPSQIVIRIDTS